MARKNAVAKFNFKLEAWKTYKTFQDEYVRVLAQVQHMRRTGERIPIDLLERERNLKTHAAFAFDRYLRVRFQRVS